MEDLKTGLNATDAMGRGVIIVIGKKSSITTLKIVIFLQTPLKSIYNSLHKNHTGS
jgi:hypothetical protein